MDNQERAPRHPVRSWSTKNAPTDAVVDYWRQARERAYVKVQTDPLAPNFYGSIRLQTFEDFSISYKIAGAETARRSRTQLATGTETDHYFYFLFQTRGSIAVEQGGRVATALPGSVVIYDSAEPFVLRAEKPYEQVVLEVRAAQLMESRALSNPSDYTAHQFQLTGPETAGSAFITSFGRTLSETPNVHLFSPAVPELASAILMSALGEHRRQESDTYMRALDLLERLASHPGLRAEHIASELHVSVRTLHRAFAEHASRFSEQLRDIRLRRAKRLMGRYPDLTMPRVAKSAGFTNESQLYRALQLDPIQSDGPALTSPREA
ncbi:helix-turn-helix domain-containing protein [Microbacterium sp. R1]|uniref:AraC-like ligand-binding domain-containing protein n=1 Tax=Microbacterium sp. R1 TaxID=322686 RepID=UPI00187D60DB|nr:helix-turn-helix domain-containing protein [Microbacterium sp. R1]MBE7956351.1 helix-turn-helix domain-containing protein [Microbacterium sp. R1]